VGLGFLVSGLGFRVFGPFLKLFFKKSKIDKFDTFTDLLISMGIKK